MIKENDIVLVDYTLSTEDGEIVDTTIEEDAKKAGLNVFTYPLLLRIGDKMIFEEVEKELIGKNINEEVEVRIPPEHAYGKRDKKLVKTMSITKFIRKYGKEPRVNETVEENGKVGKVLFASQGRVTVDFNDPRAGKWLIFKGKVVKILKERDEIFHELIKKDFRLKNIDDFKIEFKDGSVEVEIPYSVWRLESAYRGKILLTFSVKKYLPEIKEIVFIERWVQEEKEKSQEEKEESEEKEKEKKEEAKEEKSEEKKAVEAKPSA